jgi:hypothetical protein
LEMMKKKSIKIFQKISQPINDFVEIFLI